MKKAAILLIAFALSCKSSQPTASPDETPKAVHRVEGTWELDFIAAPGKVLQDLYPGEKPTLSYAAKDHQVSGKNGCNNYGGPANFSEGKVHFETGKFISTRMFCPGDGEKHYMQQLARITGYSVSEDGKTLTLLSDDIATMRYRKK